MATFFLVLYFLTVVFFTTLFYALVEDLVAKKESTRAARLPLSIILALVWPVVLAGTVGHAIGEEAARRYRESKS